MKLLCTHSALVQRLGPKAAGRIFVEGSSRWTVRKSERGDGGWGADMHARRKLSVWPGAEEIACTQSAPRPWHGAGIAGTVQARGLRSGVKSGRSPKADAAAHLLKERRIIGVPRVVLPHNLKLSARTRMHASWRCELLQSSRDSRWKGPCDQHSAHPRGARVLLSLIHSGEAGAGTPVPRRKCRRGASQFCLGLVRIVLSAGG